jgi:hypothetical protein
LVNPPKLKFAIRLPSMVVVSTPAMPAFTAPSPQKKNAETPVPEVPVLASKLIEQPALPAPASPPHTEGNEPEPSSKKPEINPEPAPLPGATVANKTALVINAVAVPETAAKIPDAEIAGSFVVLPDKIASEHSNSSNGSGTVAAENTGNSKGAGGDTVDASGKSPSGSGAAGEATAGGEKHAGDTPGSGSGLAKGPATTGSGGSSPGSAGKGNAPGSATGKGSVPGAGSGPSSGAGNGSFPGITIVGGSGGGGRSRALSGSRPGYDLTIVSGGSSGGASRDLGVFGRDETVYTVYINMADTGGGPDWSMQYALVGSEPAGNGLLSPPVAAKKEPAILASSAPGEHGRRIFIAGTIDESGILHGLRSLRAADDISKAAIEALAGWKFLPAELAGRSVAVKILIGVFTTNSSSSVK